jgi:uncharacterized repeat protein (TIGR01451 family)
MEEVMRKLISKARWVTSLVVMLVAIMSLLPTDVFATLMADLIVSKWGPEAVSTTCGSRGEFMWYISVFNQGSAAADDVTVVDTLPAGVRYLSDTSGVPHSISGDVIAWNLYRLDPGTGVYFWVKVEIRSGVGAGTVLTNQVDVSTSSPENDLINNHAQTDTLVGEDKGTDVWVEKIGPDSAFPGSYMVYTINYGNGDWYCEWPLDVADAENVTITDIMSNWDEEGNMLPNYFSYVSDTSGFARSGTGTLDDPIVWTAGMLTANTCGTFQVTVYVHEDAPQGVILANDALINSSTVECDPTNNDYEVDTPVEECGIIGDYVWVDEPSPNGIQDGTEFGLDGIRVYLYEDEDGDGEIDAEDDLLDSVTTANGGKYLFENLLAGNYVVKVDDMDVGNEGLGPVPRYQGGDTAKDSNGSTSIPYTSESISLAAGEDNLTIDFGYYLPPTAVILSSFAAKSSGGGSGGWLWLGLAGLTVLAAGRLFWAKRWTG